MKFIVFCFLLSSVILSAQSSLIEVSRLKRGNFIARSDASVLKGRESYRKGNYKEAITHYESALDELPQGPITVQRRDSYTLHYLQAAIALSEVKVKQNNLTESNKILLKALEHAPQNKLIRDILTKRFRSILPVHCYLLESLGI